MDKYDIYRDISARTGGDVYIGVVGPVRTGKSTFITKFMENLVIPNITNKLQKQIATDEMPQSADGVTVMTTQPKFIPANGVKVQFKGKSTANVKLIDCVGYFVDGASGAEEGGKARLVKTPWSDEEIPFEKAGEIGTRKVIEEYSTIGIVVTTDGSFGEIPRANYVVAEERVVGELKKQGKPFIILLNVKDPQSDDAIKLSAKLEDKYGIPVMTINATKLTVDEINAVMEKILLEFPMYSFNVDIPEWMRCLPSDSPLISEILSDLKKRSETVCKMKDYQEIEKCFEDCDNFNCPETVELRLGEGVTEYKLPVKEGMFYRVLSDECGEKIENDYQLMNYIKSFSKDKNRFCKLKDALDCAEKDGYGVVLPSIDDMNLEEPVLVKQNGRYGVKLKASAPSLHIIKVDVSTEVSPIVGTEKQGEDLVNYLMKQFEDNPSGIWKTDMFGKSLNELVGEGLSVKLNAMPKDAQCKMRKTLGRMVNENKGGLLCILL